MTFQFINADGSSVTSSFSFQPIIYPLTNGSYRVLADVITSSVAPATFSLVDNVYKVENNGESSNDWYIDQTGSIVSGSNLSGSLVNVTFNLENSNGISNSPIYFSLTPINKNVSFTNESGSCFLVTNNRIDCITDITGSLTVSLVPNQTYKIKYVGKIKNCIDRILPTTDSNVNDCIVQSSMVSQTITPQNNSLYSYTAAASDLRYQPFGGNIGTASYIEGIKVDGAVSSASYSISASYAPSQYIDTSSLVNNTTFNSYTSSNDNKVNSLINSTSSYLTTSSIISSSISASYSPIQLPHITDIGGSISINQNSSGGTYIGNPFGQLAISATPAVYFDINNALVTTINEDGIVVAGDISCDNITASILAGTASYITAANNTVLGYLSDARSNIQTQLDQLNGNAGLTSIPTITNNNDGTITITSASVNLYNNPYGTGVITSYQLSPATLALDPSQLNIVTATVSNGNAIYQIIYNQTDVDDISVIPVAGINITGVDGTGWHYIEYDFGATGLALPNKLGFKDVSLNGNQRQSGLLLSVPGMSTDFSISAGSSWYSVNQTSFDVFDSYNYPTCITSYLVQSASVWSSSYGVGYINGYYNGASGLTPLAPNSCSVNFIYKILANNINGAIVVLGGQYDTLLNAQSAPVPTLPTSTADFALLTGRLIVQSGSTSPTVQSAYTTQFGAATVTTHNDLLGIQGGRGGEYYHMTQAEYLGNGTGVFVRQSGTVASASYSPIQLPNIQMFGNDVSINQNSSGGTYIGNPSGQLAISAYSVYFDINNALVTNITEDGIEVAGDISCNNITASLFNGTSSWSNNAVSSSAATSITFIPNLSNTASYVSASNDIVVGGNIVTNEAYLTGLNSNFIGAYGAGAANAWGSQFIGSQAGSGSTNAYQSVFIGDNAAINSPNAHYSVFLGVYAGSNATNANSSNFFGLYAGYNATNAYYSNFIGQYAGNGASNAYNSNFLGLFAGNNAINANLSNFFGYQAGYNATNANNSIFIGNNLGAITDTVNNAIVTGSSILIGDNTNTGGYPNSIAIGRGTKNFAAASLNIGNVIYATNIYSGSSTIATSASNSIGKVGIGTYNPVNALDVVGNISCSVITASLFNGTSSYSTTASYTTREIAGIIPNTSFGGTPLTASVTGLGLSNTNYAIGITGVDAKSWTYYNKTTGGFTISSNSATAMTGEVSWTRHKIMNYTTDTANITSLTASLFGTATNAISSSYSLYTNQAGSATDATYANVAGIANSISFTPALAITSSAANSITFIPNLSNTASYITSSNLVGIVNSSSYSLTSSAANSITFTPNLSNTASYVANLYPVNLNGYALTSSVNSLINATSSYLTTASIIASASYSLSSSAANSITFIPNLSNTASYVLNAVSSSAANSITFTPNLSNTASYVYNATTASINSGGKLVQMNDINFYSNWQSWYGSYLGSWIQLSSAGPSGIGASGPGQSPWVALASQNGFWFTTALAGDIAYRNTSGRLLFGTNGNTGPNLYIDTASNNGNVIISSKVGMSGVTSPINALDINGNISCSVITASLHLGTASYATLANTASYVLNAVSSSAANSITFVPNLSNTASYVLNAVSSSAANSITFIPNLSNTASYATLANIANYSYSGNSANTASYVLNAVSSSYVSSSNSTINTLNTTFLNSTGTLSVSSSTNIVNVNDCIITSKWFNGGTVGTWIQMSAAGPSGIGASAPGSAPWIALATGNGYWFTDSVANDIAYRNTSGRLLFGTSAGNANLYIDTNGNTIAKQKVGIGGVTSPVNSLDVTGNISCSIISASVVGSSINQMPYSSSAHALTPLAVAGSTYFRYGTPNLIFTYTGTSWISSSMSN